MAKTNNTGDSKKRPRPRPRNPFAGVPKSGAGFHSERGYGKKDRIRKKREIDEELGKEEPEEDR